MRQTRNLVYGNVTWVRIPPSPPNFDFQNSVMSKFLEPYAELGRKLDEAFRRAEYAEAAFSDLAVEHVHRARIYL